VVAVPRQTSVSAAGVGLHIHKAAGNGRVFE